MRVVKLMWNRFHEFIEQLRECFLAFATEANKKITYRVFLWFLCYDNHYSKIGSAYFMPLIMPLKK